MNASTLLRLQLLPLLLLPVLSAGCSSDDDSDMPMGPEPEAPVGAVFAMTNGDGQPAAGMSVAGPNSVVSYARFEDGTLEFVGTFSTSGTGGDFDGGEGLDPLISANAVELTPDNTRLLAVNAGSNTVTSFLVNADMSLTSVSTVPTGGTGPNSIATDGSMVFVTNIDDDGDLTGGEPAQVGNVSSFTIDADGNLTLVDTAVLENRPSNVRMSTDGGHIIISSINSGSIGLTDDSIASTNGVPNDPDEVVVHPVDANGMILARSGTAFSSYRDINGNLDAEFEGPNEMGTFTDPVTGGTALTTFRNLPSPIGMYVAPSDTAGSDLIVVTETREFSAFGGPPALPSLESGSVSTFLLDSSDGSIAPVAAGTDFILNAAGDPNQLTTCWIAAVPNPDGSLVAYLANTINTLISSVLIQPDGSISLIESIAAAGAGPFGPGEDNTNVDTGGAPIGEFVFGNTDAYIDMSMTADGSYLYVLTGLAGTIEVFERNATTNAITRIQTVDAEDMGDEGEIPTQNSQGVVAF